VRTRWIQFASLLCVLSLVAGCVASPTQPPPTQFAPQLPAPATQPPPTLVPTAAARATAPALQTPTAPAPAAPTPAAEARKKLTIAGVVFILDSFMQTVQAGIKDAADSAGVDVILDDTSFDLDKEAATIDDYIKRKVDAIVITPIDGDGSVAALKKAKEAGITIICFNTCVNQPGVASAFLVSKNEDLGMKTGEAAVKFIEDKLGGKANIGLINCDSVQGCPPRKAGFKDQLKGLPNAKIVAQALRTQQAGQFCELPLAPDEAGKLHGQVGGDRIEAWERWKVLPQVGGKHLPEMLGVELALQSVLAQIAQARAEERAGSG
jgi:hypothetical protein